MKPNSIINLEGNWKYRWGNSPVDKQGRFFWLSNNDIDTSWHSINKPADIASLPGARELWIKIHLSNYDLSNSALFINRVEKIFEVYVDSSRIYSFGNFTKEEKIPLMGFAWHLIKLPENSNGKTLFFRIRSDSKYIGVYSEIRLGQEESFLSEIIKANLGKTILGIIFVFAGLVFSIMLLIFGKIRPFVGPIIFMTAGGIWTLANSYLTQIFFYAPKVIYYADHLALFACSIGFLCLLLKLLIPGTKKSSRGFINF